MLSNERGRRILRGWTRIVIRRASLVLFTSLAMTVMLATYTVLKLGLTTDTEDMIAEDLPWRQDFIRFRDEFPQRFRTVIVVVSAETQALADEGVGYLDGLLDGMPDFVVDSYAPTSDRPLAGRELLYLDLPELEELADGLAAAQPFIGRLREDFGLPALLDLLAKVTERENADDSGHFIDEINNVINATLTGDDAQLDWSRLQSDGEVRDLVRRLIIVKPVLDRSRPRRAGAAIEALTDAGRQTELAFDHRLAVRLTGTIALEDEELVSVTRNATVAGILALVSVMIVLLLAFRSVRLLLISTATLLAGLVGTAGFAAWAVGDLNVISVAFAVLYIGLGIDFVIHYLLRVRELARQGESVPAALETASADVGGSLIICAITTAAGFYSFIPTSFLGVSQLGLISGTGMFISLAATLTLLPALVRVFFGERLPVTAGAADWAPGLRLYGLMTYRKSVVSIPAVLAFVSILVLPQIRFESDPMLLRDPDTETVQTFRDLSRDPDTSPTSISIVVAPDIDVAKLKSDLMQLPTVERVVSLASFQVDDYEDKIAVLDDLALMLGPSFHRFGPLASVNVAQTRRALAELRLAITDLGDRVPAVFRRLTDALARLESRLDSAADDGQRSLLERLQANLLDDLPRAMALLSWRMQPAPPEVASFPRSFVDRWRGPSGARIVDVVPAVDVTMPEQAARFVADVRTVAPHATGLPVVYQEAGDTVVRAFMQAFLYASLAISLLLLLFLRSAWDTVLVLIPVALAFAITAGITVLIDLPFNFANIITLPLLLGIGVDNGIHMVRRSRELSGTQGHVLGTSTSRAILFSTITTLVSFGTLALSSHLGMASMGILLGVGLAVLLIVVMIVLPALLDWERP